MSLTELIAFGPQIGPFLSGIGLIFTAGAAWTTYLFYYRKTTDTNWLDTFRKLYEEYWKSDEMARMRKYLASEDEYAKLEAILIKRLADATNKLDTHENDILELVDRFCALMIRILSFGEVSTKPRQKSLYNPLFNYWIVTIKKRRQLMLYLENCWEPLHARLQRIK